MAEFVLFLSRIKTRLRNVFSASSNTDNMDNVGSAGSADKEKIKPKFVYDRNIGSESEGFPPGDPNPRGNHADFPDKWPEDRDIISIYFVTTPEKAAEVTREVYYAIDDGIISANIYVIKSERSVAVTLNVSSVHKGKGASKEFEGDQIKKKEGFLNKLKRMLM